MPRPHGNARKKKSRLTDHTLSTLVNLKRPVAAEAPGAGSATTVEPVPIESSILDLLYAQAPDAPVVPAAYNDAALIFKGSAAFPTERYVFGLVMCPECRNEMTYYQDRDILARGYAFRCRICRHEVRAALD